MQIENCLRISSGCEENEHSNNISKNYCVENSHFQYLFKQYDRIYIDRWKIMIADVEVVEAIPSLPHRMADSDHFTHKY
jgi:hypothetical protein